MKRFIDFGSIQQFRSVVKTISENAAYHQEPVPTLVAFGTEKVHGTNAAVCYSHKDGFWVQNRTTIIEPAVNDNAECAMYANKNKEAWLDIIKKLAQTHNIDLDNNIISVYFEWCGKGIQKNTCVQGIDKKLAIIFAHFKVSPLEPNTDIPAYWLPTQGVDSVENDIYNVSNFPSFALEIDFNQPKLAQNDMVDITSNIEAGSGISKHFGLQDTVGEGVVWTVLYKGNLMRWKVKGEKHSKSKVKTLTPVDLEKEKEKIAFAEYALPGWRLEQMFDLANDTLNGGEPDIKNMGTFIKMVGQDVLKEELDIMVERGLERKEVMPYVSKMAANWFKEQL